MIRIEFSEEEKAQIRQAHYHHALGTVKNGSFTIGEGLPHQDITCGDKREYLRACHQLR